MHEDLRTTYHSAAETLGGTCYGAVIKINRNATQTGGTLVESLVNAIAEIEQAAKRIGPHARRTWLEHSPYFSSLCHGEIYLKLENLQKTGSFKVRGALNKVLSLSESAKNREIVTASSGNHGAAVAFALREAGLRGIVFVPENASPMKVENIRRLGGEVRFHALDSSDTEAGARAYAESRDATYIPPYNDAEVIAGQGTVALELLEDLSDLQAVVVAVGGGGLISGIAAYLKMRNPKIWVIGVSPENSQVMIQSIRAGRILDLASKPTLSDGTAGGVEPGAITFALMQKHVDELVTVDEAEIAEAMRNFMAVHHMLVEGAAGVALAGVARCAERLRGKKAAVVVCGANVSFDVLRDVLA